MERDPMEMALSTDIIMDVVLSYLKDKDLLACRRVSKFWNKAASSVLRNRSAMIKGISVETELMELQGCIQQSWDFPFAGLVFFQPWKLSSAGAMQFFKDCGPRFTRLRLDTPWTFRLQDLAPFINHLPRLSILEVGRSHGSPPRPDFLDSAAVQEGGRILKLSSVRTIRILSSCREVNEDVLRELLMATSPSLRIECLGDTSYGILRAIKSAGKLQALSVLYAHEVEQQPNYALMVDNLLSTETPALTKLDFNPGGCFSKKGLMKLLFSIQHTLKDLRLYRTCLSDFLSECPVLANLISLDLYIVGRSYEYVFQGSHGHKFPALKELDLELSSLDVKEEPPKADVSDGLFIVPSLTKIHFEGHVDKAAIEDLARSFPNVIEIQLYKDFYDFGWSWHSDPTDIWSVGAFKFLEKLRILCCSVESPTKIIDNLSLFSHRINFKKFKTMNMDSFLTGIPFTICENLRKHNQQNLMDSPFNEILRDSPNILQLKNLKELVVCVSIPHDAELEELPEEPPFISMVSVWYALQMMPNLQAKFVYEDNSWSLEENQEDKEVTILKAAFKNVQPYVKLEPFPNWNFPHHIQVPVLSVKSSASCSVKCNRLCYMITRLGSAP